MKKSDTNDSSPAPFAPAMCSASYSDQSTREYQCFIESMAQYCHCQSPHDRPCDCVLAGGLCDARGCEPDFTLDDLEWSEEYE
jgi:hypothetical protein